MNWIGQRPEQTWRKWFQTFLLRLVFFSDVHYKLFNLLWCIRGRQKRLVPLCRCKPAIYRVEMGRGVPGEAVGRKGGKLLCTLSVSLSVFPVLPLDSLALRKFLPLLSCFCLSFFYNFFNMVGFHNSNLFCFCLWFNELYFIWNVFLLIFTVFRM